jgi:hypothetical protein
MKAFHCDHCGNLIFFENVSCLRCNHTLGFIPERTDLCALEPLQGNFWQPLGSTAHLQRYRQCRNSREYQVCNWLVAENDASEHCRACRLNLLIPDLAIEGNLERWRKLEQAKRRVLYSLLRFKLRTEEERGRAALRFKFLGDQPGGATVLTGHHLGVITINIAEADDAERERRRVELHEPLRTLLGHLRHEVAHYYWDRLVANGPELESFRGLFGDERQNYDGCLRQHYQHGPRGDWQEHFVTVYASCHPWEDWAETWAHYLHIVDTLETAGSFGVLLRPRHPQAATMRADPKDILEGLSNFEEILRNWIPLTQVLNEINRGMGLPDLYPFVLSPDSVRKLRFVHRLLQKNIASDREVPYWEQASFATDWTRNG